jgi:DNA-binding NarL/FixJ family response regulator
LADTVPLLLTDVAMPQKSGLRLARRVQAILPEMRLRFMSGYIEDALLRQGIEEGKVALLSKPYALDALAHAVRDTLGGKALSLETTA